MKPCPRSAPDLPSLEAWTRILQQLEKDYPGISDRIAICVNACMDLTNEQIQSAEFQDMVRTLKVRDRLRKAGYNA